MSRKLDIYVMGKKNGAVDVIDIIERKPFGKTIRMVRYKGETYPVIGRDSSARIYVGNT